MLAKKAKEVQLFMMLHLQFPAGFEDVASAKLKANLNCEIIVQESGFMLGYAPLNNRRVTEATIEA
ncbi:MAG: hypothetical protein WAS94_03915 [Candidatus Saccharimonadales bacterium]